MFESLAVFLLEVITIITHRLKSRLMLREQEEKKIKKREVLQLQPRSHNWWKNTEITDGDWKTMSDSDVYGVDCSRMGWETLMGVATSYGTDKQSKALTSRSVYTL